MNGDPLDELDEAWAEVKRLRAEIKLLEAAHASSHSGFMVMASGVENAAAEIERLRLTDAERAAIDRVRRAFRDMDHNDMTMQQVEDYEAICGLLERHGTLGSEVRSGGCE